MAERLTIRASSMPLVTRCVMSQLPDEGEVLINEWNEPANTGSAIHAWAAEYIMGKRPDLEKIARQFGVADVDDLRFLSHQVRAAWAFVQEFLPDDAEVSVEQPLSLSIGDLEITGTADIVVRMRDPDDGKTWVIVIDLKSGRVDSDFTPQLWTYALLAISDPRFEDADMLMSMVFRLRDGERDIERISASDAVAYLAEIQRIIKNGTGVYQPGQHCTYCPRRLNCAAHQQYEQSVMQAIETYSGVTGVLGMPWTEETHAELGPAVGELWDKLKHMEKRITDYLALIKEKVDEYGDLEIDDTFALKRSERSRREVETTIGLPILQEHLGQRAHEAIKISMSDAEKIIREESPRGSGKGNIDAFKDAMDEAGAVKRNEFVVISKGKIA